MSVQFRLPALIKSIYYGLFNLVYRNYYMFIFHLFWPIAFIVIPIGYLIHLEYEQNYDNEI